MSKFSFKAKAGITALLLAVSCLFPLGVSAKGTGYHVDAYDVAVTVGVNDTLDITERITADFTEPRHGIIHSIPVSGKVTAQVGGKVIRTGYHNAVRAVSVTDGTTGSAVPFSKGSADGSVVLKIGDASHFVAGEKIYVVRYRYLIGPGSRESPDYDMFYYNLIGTGWDTSISQATFAVTMPKAFDTSQLTMTAGSYGTSDESAVTYRVSGDTVSGRVSRVLAAGEGLTMRLSLPKGYFAVPRQVGGTGLTLAIILMGTGSLVLFWLFGRDKRLYVPVEVSPPEDLNSAEAGYIIDGHADVRDVVSLLIYWADKGFLSISSGKKGKFTLHKLREPDGTMKPYETKMFTRLFQKDDSVKADDLHNSFYTTVAEVKNELAGSFLSPDRRIYASAGNMAKKLCFLLGGLCTAVSVGRAAAFYYLSAGAGLIAGVICGVLTVLFGCLIGYLAERYRADSKAGIVGVFLLEIVCLGLILFLTVHFSGTVGMALAAFLAAVVSSLAGAYAEKRTDRGNRWLGSLMGLKRYIQMVEKRQLEAAVEKDPTVFYHILPFAYVLGVTNKWVKQFETIALPPPDWFCDESGSMFSAVYFWLLFDRNMTSFRNNMISTPPNTSGFSSGGSFSGGGGFTGGGMGGGGGSSW